MRIGIYGRTFDPSNAEVLTALVASLQQHEAVLFFENTYFDKVRDFILLEGDPHFFNKHDNLSGRIDYLLSIGGDGTLLDTVTMVGEAGIPVLGINTGRLGFLSSVAHDQIAGAVQALKEKNFWVDERTLIHLDAEQPYFGNHNYALNELSVHRKSSPSLIAIQVWIDQAYVTAYWADGLLICTPTGSTGYSLSCGGPIMYPQANTWLITPIATHNLTVRPLVIPDNKCITVKVDARYGHYIAGLDARYAEVTPGEQLRVTKEKFSLHIIQFKHEEFFQTIREKLKWGLDNRN
jgi:NAD+ kinase